MKGIVFKSTGSWYDILGNDDKLYTCRTRGKLRLEGFQTTNPIAVGDNVEFEIEDQNSKQGIVTAIHPRDNYIIRQSIQKKVHGHIIAANVDQTILVVTLVYPRTSLGFIDRFLVAAEAFRIPQVLVFNKQDIISNEIELQQEEIIATYESIGVHCLKTCASTGDGLSEVMDILKGKKTLISGHSGVGKSTLLNNLSSEVNQKTSEVSDFAEKGVHTTTFAEMFRLSEDTFVIDTPGIKEFGLIDIYDEELSDFFPEMRALQTNCKFHNCTHNHEPKCAVIDAVDNGEIAESRYMSYLSMLLGDDNRN